LRIEQIRLKNFKVFQDVVLKDLQPFTVFVGANGSGKGPFTNYRFNSGGVV